MISFIKAVTRQSLIDNGWTGIDVGKGHTVHYCEVCGVQRVHYCTGKKEDNGHTIMRIECNTCRSKLNGGNKHATNLI